MPSVFEELTGLGPSAPKGAPTVVDVIIRPVDIERDAEQLATMFNESELAWPGGWTAGMPMTGDIIREWLEEGRTLVTYVAEVDGRVVGYCSFMENTPWLSGQYGSGYLDLLNVHPAYHGRSIGRKLVQATIERAAQEGWVYQTLGTWSANRKSVPAYKKTGHFWRPDTSVWMQNFVPGALQMPLARPFFDRHDWYESYVRAIDQHPDDERWEGMKVYREHWEADGESLTIWIDREAQAPCAIETDDVMVAAIPSDIEPLQGSSVRINWRIQNKGTSPIHAHVHAMGADGLEIDHREAFVVPAGLTVEHVAEVKVTDQAPHGKIDETAPAVRSLIMLDHNEVELFSGLRARKPLSIDTDPGKLSLAPGIPTTVALQLHSELAEAVTATCYIVPSPGVQVDWTSQPVTIGGGGHVALPLTLTAEAGMHTLQARLAPDEQGRAPVKEEIVVFSVPPGEVLAQGGGESARAETDALRVAVEGRLGALTVTHKLKNISLLTVLPTMGPPYYPGNFDKNHFGVRVEVQDGKALVHMQAEPQFHTDTLLRVTVAIAASGLVTIEEHLENRAMEPYRGRLGLEGRWSWNVSPVLTHPLTLGLVQAPLADYPMYGKDGLRDPESYAEPWIAGQARGLVTGIGWDDSTAELRNHEQFDLLGPALELGRGERSPVLRGALWAGVGDWRAAREELMAWAGKPAGGEDVAEPETRPVVRAVLDRPLLATIEDVVEADLTLDSATIRRQSGKVTMVAEGGLVVEPATVSVVELSREAVQRSRLTIRVPGRPGGYALHADMQLLTLASRSTAEVLRLGAPGTVAVERAERAGHSVWTIENGSSALAVAEDFGPNVVSWIWNGQEQVVSPYPEPGDFAWAYPWYGGINVALALNHDGEGCGLLVKERFTGQEIVVDSDDLPWRGVRLSTRPERKELHDIGVEVDYLTLPESPLLKMVLRLTNLRPTRQQTVVGGAAALGLGVGMEQLMLRGEDVSHQPTPWATGRRSQTWGMVTHAESGMSALAVCPQGKLWLQDCGMAGRLLGLSADVSLPGNAVHELTWYLVLSESRENALSFKSLVRL